MLQSYVKVESPVVVYLLDEDLQRSSNEESDIYSLLLTIQIKEHLAKGQRMLASDGMSQVTKTLLDLTQRKNFYAGDLLMSVEILRNVTDTFKRASYIPASDGVQVREKSHGGKD